MSTPRTDAISIGWGRQYDSSHLFDLSRELEEKLNAALKLTNINTEFEISKLQTELGTQDAEIIVLKSQVVHLSDLADDLQKERDSLRQQLAEADKVLADIRAEFKDEPVGFIINYIKEMKGQLAEAQKDKERLDWLESQQTIFGEEVMGITFTWADWTMREAIDRNFPPCKRKLNEL